MHLRSMTYSSFTDIAFLIFLLLYVGLLSLFFFLSVCMYNLDPLGKDRTHLKMLLRRKVVLSMSHPPMVDGMALHMPQNQFHMKHGPRNQMSMKKLMANYKLILLTGGTYRHCLSFFCFFFS